MKKLTDLINTPLQRGGTERGGAANRFNGFRRGMETLETAYEVLLLPSSTPLKRGVNEIS